MLPRIVRAICILLALCSMAAADSFDVTMNTTALIGNSAGPCSVLLIFTDGSSAGDANNTTTLNNFQFGGGNALGNPFVVGGASGSLETGVSITDSSFVNLFIESFSAGTQLSFNLVLTANDDLNGVPDRLTFSILDNTDTPIPTLAPVGDYFWGADLHSTGSVIDAYASDLSRTSIFIPVPTFTPIPEPATICVLATGVAVAARRQRRYRSTKR